MLAVVLTVALCPSSHAEEVVTLPNHLHKVSTFPNNKFGPLYDLCILWRSNTEIVVRVPGPVIGIWKLTKEELPEYLETKMPKSNLLVSYIAEKASKYPIPIEEVFRQLEAFATYFKALGYKRVVVAGYFGPLGTFGPYYAYDSDGDDNKADPKARLY